MFAVNGPPMPNIYHENALLRFHKEKSVQVILGGKRHPVGSKQAFVNHGWDFDDVVAYANHDDTKCIPAGNPLDS